MDKDSKDCQFLLNGAGWMILFVESKSSNLLVEDRLLDERKVEIIV